MSGWSSEHNSCVVNVWMNEGRDGFAPFLFCLLPTICHCASSDGPCCRGREEKEEKTIVQGSGQEIDTPGIMNRKGLPVGKRSLI